MPPTHYSVLAASATKYLLIALLTCAFPLVAADTIVGKVVAVADGDTLTVLDALKHQHKIRLSGVDAPEGGQAFGKPSKQALSDCAFGKQAMVDGDKSDRYGRRVGNVMVNGLDCNLRQIERGYAEVRRCRSGRENSKTWPLD